MKKRLTGSRKVAWKLPLNQAELVHFARRADQSYGFARGPGRGTKWRQAAPTGASLWPWSWSCGCSARCHRVAGTLPREHQHSDGGCPQPRRGTHHARPFPGQRKGGGNEGNPITTMPDAYPAGSAWRWERHVCEDFGSGFKDHGSKRVLLNILRGDNFYEIKLKLVGVILSD